MPTQNARQSVEIIRNHKICDLCLEEKCKKDCEHSLCYSVDKTITAFEDAIKALEKQIPKHIKEQTEEDREFIDYVCPNCKTTLQQKMKGAKRTTIYKYKHCIFCGQSLDWSDHPPEKGDVEG